MRNESQPSVILGRPFLATGRTLIDVQKGKLTYRVHKKKMVINVFEAIPHPEEEDAEECMRVDVIDQPIKEIQKEDALLKTTAKPEVRLEEFNETNQKIVLQEKDDATPKEKPMNELKPPDKLSSIAPLYKQKKEPPDKQNYIQDQKQTYRIKHVLPIEASF
ncbi:hypothetical protein PIB30_061422 [Stylosanthes scabra]|uniref:Uncharacterized protein n=1 Tax=Stylosanthes scabra TaxID=79078 RepID=A0ABU6XJ32_9FABA|nr:hypothetical protein [Stylosanthes scabra]